MAFTKRDDASPVQSKAPAEDDRTIDDLFKPVVDLETVNNIFAAIQGRPKVGKSTFCLSAVAATDGPVYVIDTEGAIALNSQFFPKDQRERIFVAQVLQFAGKANNKVNLVDSLDALMEAINKISDAAIAQPEIKGTIIVDSATDIWDWLGIWLDEVADVKRTKTGAMPRFEWGKANEKYAEIMYMLKRTGWNVLLTYRSKEACNSEGTPLGYDVPRWQKNTAHWVDLIMEMKNDDRRVIRFHGGRFGDRLPDLENPSFGRLIALLEKESGVKFV
jgi:hypothetical protein